MNENMYTLLNEMDHEVENYETWDVSSDEVGRWKTAFYQRRKNEISRKHANRYVAAAAVVLVIMFAMSPLRSQVYAKIIAVTSDIKEWFSINNDISPYETIVGESVSRSGITVTLDEVIVDGKDVVIAYTITTDDVLTDDSWTDDKYRDDALICIDGKWMHTAQTGGSGMVDEHNLTGAITFVIEDIDLATEHDYKIRFSVGGKPIGIVKFTASGEKLLENTITIPLDEKYEFPNGEKIEFTRYTYNPFIAKIYCESETYGFQYDTLLKGKDNLGNEIEFYPKHFAGDDEGWFVPKEHNMIKEEATSLTLSLYAREYPEESGEITGEYQVIGEPFTITIR